MPKETWIIAAVLTIALLLGLLGFSSYDKKQRLDQAQTELARAQDEIAKSKAKAGLLQDELTADEDRLRQLQQEKQAVVKTHQSLEDEMRTALESKDVTISKLQGRLTVNILDHILFNSGEAELKGDGEAVLRKVAGILQQHTNLMVHVVGHTDNVPIRPAARARFPSNWELSTARAAAAVRFLAEKADIDPRRLGVVGYGEFRPVADNATAEGRARNRRIAITILPDTFDAAPTASQIASGAPAMSSSSEIGVSTNVAPSPSAGSSADAPPQAADSPAKP